MQSKMDYLILRLSVWKKEFESFEDFINDRITDKSFHRYGE